MNKKTILGLLLIANLYGQMASANELVISAERLQTISQKELNILAAKGVIANSNGKVILNLQKLDSMLKDKQTVIDIKQAAKVSESRNMPYMTDGDDFVKGLNDAQKTADALSARFIPYGYT